MRTLTDWLTPVNVYCERLDAGWWAEPVNALTNIAFFIAGLLILAHRRPPARVLGSLIILIGVGSFLFHTMASRVTGLLDVLAIAVYLVTYAWLWPKWTQQAGKLTQTLSVAGLLLAIALATVASQWLAPASPWVPPGSYLGAWIYLLVIAVMTTSAQQPGASWLWFGAVTFVFSMAARQLDMPTCQTMGGTHWAWHILNAVVLYASARALLLGSSHLKAVREV